MSTPRLLPDGRVIARVTVTSGWAPYELSKEIHGALIELLAHDPAGMEFLRASVKVDSSKRDRGDRLHVSVVWQPELDGNR